MKTFIIAILTTAALLVSGACASPEATTPAPAATPAAAQTTAPASTTAPTPVPAADVPIAKTPAPTAPPPAAPTPVPAADVPIAKTPAPTAPPPAAPTPVPAADVPIAKTPAPTAPPPAAPTQTPAPDKKPMLPTGEAAITYKDLKIEPGTVKVGETAKVSVSVTNIGGPLNLPVVLKVNGKVVDEQTLTCKIDIDCDETKEANFNIKMNSSGTYTVSVGDQTAKLVVQ